MTSNKIELIYIDKQNWKHGLHLLKTINRANESTHEFTMKRNIVNLYTEKDTTTITTKDNLKYAIEKHLLKHKLDSITIVDYELTLEEVFNEILNISSEYNIDIKVIEKSKYPIRSNVTVTIDLSVFDKKTKYEDIKNIIEDELEKSLNNARKSKEPRHSSDLGVNIKHQDILKDLMQSLSEYNIDDIDYIEDIDDLDDIDNIDYLDIYAPSDFSMDEYEMYDELKDIAEFTNLKDELNKMDEIFVSYGENGDLTIISYLDKIIISKDLNDISINKEEAKKLMKVLEVMINE